MVEAWHELLADVPFDDAMEAVKSHYRTEARPVFPADIRRATIDRLPAEDSWMGFTR